MENVRKHRDIKLVTTERRRNYLVSEPNYHTTKFFTGNLLAIKMKKTKILLNKSVHLGLSMLELPKYGEKVNSSFIDTDSFIIYIKTDDTYKNIADNVETRFDTSNYESERNSIDRPLPKGKY